MNNNEKGGEQSELKKRTTTKNLPVKRFEEDEIIEKKPLRKRDEENEIEFEIDLTKSSSC
jgi:hypothetical protein